MKNLNFTLLIIFLQIPVLKLQAQTEYFVSVDPATGIHTRIDSLQGVRWITGFKSASMDKINNRYFFHGKDSADVWRFYTIDGNTGATLNSPAFPTYIGFQNACAFEYDNSSGMIYGLVWDSIVNKEYFITLSPSTGVVTNSVHIPNITSVWPGTYDQNNKRFFFGGNGFGYNDHIIYAPTGSVISTVPLSGQGAIQYNNTTNKLYGVFPNQSAAEVREIDPVTMSYSVLTTLPGGSGLLIMGYYASIDEINNRFTFVLAASSKTLFTVDLNTGAVISSTLFPLAGNPLSYNICHLVYNNTNGILYGLHWGPANQPVLVGVSEYNFSEKQNFDLFPNPMSTTSYLDLKGNRNNVRVKIVNSSGAIIQDSNFQNVSGIEIHKANLAPGIYFTTVIADNTISTRKMVVD